MRGAPFLLAILAAGGAAAVLGRYGGYVRLASYSTSVVGRSRNQRHNAELAMRRLNGARVAPHGLFSFNDRVGSFARDDGYRKAPVSYNGQLITDWGGGVCQTSTTLYNAALLSGMRIVERNRHRFMPSYVPPGRDAAVAFSSVDLKFENPYDFPIEVRGSLTNGRLEVSLYGPQDLPVRPQVLNEIRAVTRPSEYFVGSQSGAQRVRNTGKRGYSVRVLRYVGERRELISADEYPAMDRVRDDR